VLAPLNCRNVSPEPRLVPVATTVELLPAYNVSTPSKGLPSLAMTSIVTVPKKDHGKKGRLRRAGRGMSK